ncbi:hypothetical protein ACFRAO_40885 [Streptomyces sp. NPDC056656]|uniref:hypothetical protein n=1 Tax=Streptomyces sp. NPDC056656 TaxID=3345895 RepID=UPI0036BFA409
MPGDDRALAPGDAASLVHTQAVALQLDADLLEPVAFPTALLAEPDEVLEDEERPVDLAVVRPVDGGGMRFEGDAANAGVVVPALVLGDEGEVVVLPCFSDRPDGHAGGQRTELISRGAADQFTAVR